MVVIKWPNQTWAAADQKESHAESFPFRLLSPPWPTQASQLLEILWCLVLSTRPHPHLGECNGQPYYKYCVCVATYRNHGSRIQNRDMASSQQARTAFWDAPLSISLNLRKLHATKNQAFLLNEELRHPFQIWRSFINMHFRGHQKNKLTATMRNSVELGAYSLILTIPPNVMIFGSIPISWNYRHLSTGKMMI